MADGAVQTSPAPRAPELRTAPPPQNADPSADAPPGGDDMDHDGAAKAPEPRGGGAAEERERAPVPPPADDTLKPFSLGDAEHLLDCIEASNPAPFPKNELIELLAAGADAPAATGVSGGVLRCVRAVITSETEFVLPPTSVPAIKVALERGDAVIMLLSRAVQAPSYEFVAVAAGLSAAKEFRTMLEALMFMTDKLRDLRKEKNKTTPQEEARALCIDLRQAMRAINRPLSVT